MSKQLLTEAKKSLELAIVKCLTGGKLSTKELYEMSLITQASLIKDHGCDMFMVETIKQHVKQENNRIRSQNLLTKLTGLNSHGHPTTRRRNALSIVESLDAKQDNFEAIVERILQRSGE
jgi:hypothetical protein